jgi:hypothetical protein
LLLPEAAPADCAAHRVPGIAFILDATTAVPVSAVGFERAIAVLGRSGSPAGPWD